MSHTETLPRTSTDTATTRRSRPALVLALTCAATAMVGLDTAIVNVALPSIQRDLGAGYGTLQWVVVAYGLLLGGFLLLGGRLADRLGRRRVLVAGLAVFAGASLAAGAAHGAGLLIAARGAQGLGAALTVPAALSLLAVTFPEGRDRHRALALVGAVDGAAGALGVVLSGLLTAGPGWRWAFLLNVPVGVVLIALATVFLTTDRAGERTGRLDVAGAATVTGALLLFVYALHHAAGHGWLAGSTLALFAAAAALLAAFVQIERRSADPLVPPSTLRNRPLVAANITGFLAFGALLAFIFIGSLLMQQVLGYSPATTGLAWLATTVTIVVAAMAGERLVARAGVRAPLVIGLSLLTVGALWLARVPADATYATDVLPAFLLAGVGFGLCGPAVQIGALSGVSRAASGLASGLVETMREIGGAAGVATVSAVLVAGSGLDGFHTAFALVAVLAVLGLVATLVGFARRR
ncbi:MFS transporter [Jiangella aurantiaca]|uniref:MFS transporter n=1 Tax=Jiangella aurantiaca TaxID=2530373 RepID=A0A4R5AM64_9ACTN|nr:MFS transporter [Jiangella aurantiaca]TDD71282.1 MFS transporter [Jiangella aurantiaca]